MERYELANGKVYEISRWSDTCTVAYQGKVVYTGSYAGCRKYINSQKCPYEEVDGRDRQAYHVFLRDETGIKAYLRVLDRGVSFEEVSIGRVLTTERRRGYGHKILDAGIAAAREKYGAETIRIEAQTYARKLYEDHGFRQDGEEFLEDDIPHIPMIWHAPKD